MTLAPIQDFRPAPGEGQANLQELVFAKGLNQATDRIAPSCRIDSAFISISGGLQSHEGSVIICSYLRRHIFLKLYSDCFCSS